MSFIVSDGVLEDEMRRPEARVGTSQFRGFLIRGLAMCVAACSLLAPWTALAVENEAGLAAAATIESKTLRDYVETLANDTFEGRAAGTRGGRAAAIFLVKKFENFDLQPAGKSDSYFQQFGAQYQNILGVMPGSDPTLQNQYIIVGAHYDHVGYGTPKNSNGPIGQIHNGADDNASGVATLLEVIEALQHLPGPPRRPILFALWDCEENELSGSNHWVENPTVPRRGVVAACNLDMVGRLKRRKLEVIGWRSQAGLRRLIAEQNSYSSIPLTFTWEVKRNSDHYSFFRMGIPIVMFHTGLHDDYHRPSDDAEKLDYDGMEHVARLVFGTVRALADRDGSPGFRNDARTETTATRQVIEAPMPTPAGRLGVEWADDDEPGLRVTRVVDSSAAFRAGLRPGDRLLSFGDVPLGNGTDLRSLVVASPVNVNIVIQRPGEEANETRRLTLRGEPARVGISWREDAAEPATLILVQIIPGSPADRAGLKLGDRIHEVDGVDFQSDEEFQQLIRERPLPMSFLIERDGLMKTIELPNTPTVASADAATTNAGQ
ncbi:MAG: M20/M25/M40 family metallo-hydrolase [Planctomycetes bacterium]|nr:M20/M25/M40 family metallo-hydrolase [Planctomycetota bacterium]